MSLFGGNQPNAATKTVASGVTINSSVYGKTVPIIYGTARCAGNLIWYGDFAATPQGSGGGKGGGPGGKSGGSTSYTYSAYFANALCEGPIGRVLNQWANKTEYSWSYATANNIDLKNGALGQSPWGYLSTKHAGQDLGYSGTAYVYYQPGLFGTSAQMQNLSYEVQGFGNGVFGTPDADPAFVVSDLLTNLSYGVGFPAARLGDLSIFSNYCRAAGLVVSVLLDTQQDAASTLNDIVQQCNSEFVWSGGQLTVVPYGDQPLSANGASYAPPAAALYSLTDDDFINTGTSDPVAQTRARPSDRMNSVKLEWLNRSNQYAAEIVEAKDQAAIEAYGLRASSPKQAHLFTTLSAATMSATLQLQRQAIRNQFTFTLGWKYAVLDPMDIVEITDVALGLNQQWVRILSIEEDDNGNLRVTTEEYLGGAGGAPLYSFQSGFPYIANYNVDPGNVNAPVFAEPPLLIEGGIPQFFIGVSGASANWGGCDIWMSFDGSNYEQIGHVGHAANMGVTTTAAIPALSGVDTTSLVSLNLTGSQGALPAASHQSAASYLQTSVWICNTDYSNAEMIGYGAGPALTGRNSYNLEDNSNNIYLLRGQLGTAPTSHPVGSLFMLLDGGVFSMPLPSQLVGATLYFKFPSINIYGGSGQSLAAVPAYTFTPTGYATTVATPGAITPSSAIVVQNDGTVISAINMNWVASVSVVGQYEVNLQFSGAGTWDIKHVISGASNSFQYAPAKPGQLYDIRVRAFMTIGGQTYYSGWSTYTGFQAQAQGNYAARPSGLAIRGTTRGYSASWTNPSDSDYGYSELWMTDVTPDPRFGFSIGRFAGSPGALSVYAITQALGVTLNYPTLNGFTYFWIRSFNSSGVAGAWTPTGSGYSGWAGDFGLTPTGANSVGNSSGVAPNPPLQQSKVSNSGGLDIAAGSGTQLAAQAIGSFTGDNAIQTIVSGLTYSAPQACQVEITLTLTQRFSSGPKRWGTGLKLNSNQVAVLGDVFNASAEPSPSTTYTYASSGATDSIVVTWFAEDSTVSVTQGALSVKLMQG